MVMPIYVNFLYHIGTRSKYETFFLLLEVWFIYAHSWIMDAILNYYYYYYISFFWNGGLYCSIYTWRGQTLSANPLTDIQNDVIFVIE